MEVRAEVEKEVLLDDSAFIPGDTRSGREEVLWVVFIMDVLEARGEDGCNKDGYDDEVAIVVGDDEAQLVEGPIEEVVEFSKEAPHDGV